MSLIKSFKSQTESGLVTKPSLDLNDSDIYSDEEREDCVCDQTYYNADTLADVPNSSIGNQPSDTEFRVLKTNKGRSKLYHEVFFYTIESRSGTRVIWKCERTGNRTIIISHNQDHNQLPEF